MGEKVEYKYTREYSNSPKPLVIRARIVFLDGETGDALRNLQATVLRKVLTEIANHRRNSQQRP